MQGQACGSPEGHQVGLVPKVPLLARLDQNSTHASQAAQPAAQGGSLDGYPPG